MSNRTPLPPWWKVFAAEYLTNGGNGTAAYLKAMPGVKNHTASTEAGKLFKNPAFARYFATREAKLTAAVEMTEDRWIKRLTDIANKNPESWSSQTILNALIELGKKKKYVVEDPKEQTVNFNMMVIAEMEALRKVFPQAKDVPEVTDDIDALEQADVIQDD